MSTAALLFVFTTFASSAYAECVIGTQQTVRAIDQLNCTARWDGNCANNAQWNPEPGYVIRQARTIVHGSNSGSRSVSVIAGGSSFMSENEIRTSLNAATRAYGEYANETGKQRYSAQIEQNYNGFIRQYRNYRASHNTIDARVSAVGSGNFWDQRRGWESISVDADLVCIGAPGQSDDLTKMLLKDVSVVVSPSVDPRALRRGYVYDMDGNHIGEVSNMEAVVVENGVITKVPVEVGGFLGIGAISGWVSMADAQLQRNVEDGSVDIILQPRAVEALRALE